MKRKLSDQIENRSDKRSEDETLKIKKIHLVPELLPKVTQYYLKHFDIERATSIILDNNGFTGGSLFSCIYSGFPVILAFDFIKKGGIHQEDTILLSWTPKTSSSLLLLEPTNTAIKAISEYNGQIRAYIRDKIRDYLFGKILQIDLEEIYYTGVSLSNIFNPHPKNSSQPISYSRACVIDMDIGPGSEIRKEIGCSEDFTKFNSFNSLSVLLTYQMGCFWMMEIISDYLFYMSIKNYATHRKVDTIPDKHMELLLSGLRSFSRLMTSSSSLSEIMNKSHTDDHNKKFRFIFSGSKGLHVWLQNEFSTSMSFCDNLFTFFNNYNPEDFKHNLSGLVRWVIEMCHIGDEKNTNDGGSPAEKSGSEEDDHEQEEEDEEEKIGKKGYHIENQLDVLRRLDNLSSLLSFIPFDISIIAKEFQTTENSSSSTMENRNIKSVLNTNSSINQTFLKFCALLNIDLDNLLTTAEGKDVNFLKTEIVEKHVIPLVLNNKNDTPEIKRIRELYKHLSKTTKERVTDFCLSFILLNPILIIDTKVNRRNHKIRMPLTFNPKSSMVSFEITSMAKMNPEPTLKEIVNEMNVNWVNTKALFQ